MQYSTGDFGTPLVHGGRMVHGSAVGGFGAPLVPGGRILQGSAVGVTLRRLVMKT